MTITKQELESRFAKWNKEFYELLDNAVKVSIEYSIELGGYCEKVNELEEEVKDELVGILLCQFTASQWMQRCPVKRIEDTSEPPSWFPVDLPGGGTL